MKYSKRMNIAEIESYNNIPGITTKIQRETKAYPNWLLYLLRAKYTTQPNCIKYTSSCLVRITNTKSYQSELEQLHIIHPYQTLGFQMKTSIEFVQNKLFSVEHVSAGTFPMKTSLLHAKEMHSNWVSLLWNKCGRHYFRKIYIPTSYIHSHNTWTVIQNCKSSRTLL